jgi:hypothetical protein
VAVNAVVDDVDLCRREPFEERFFGIVQYFFPFAVPFEFFRFGFPKGAEVFFGGAVELVPIFQPRTAKRAKKINRSIAK